MSAPNPTPVLRWIAAQPDADRCIVLAAVNPDSPAFVDMSPTLTPTQLLQQRYRESLPVKHAELSAHWRQVQADPRDAAALARLQQMLHRLAGSAGAYGYTAIGNLARDADAMIILRRDPLAEDPCDIAFAARLDQPVRRVLDQLSNEIHSA